jgi:hypothetical protein
MISPTAHKPGAQHGETMATQKKVKELKKTILRDGSERFYRFCRIQIRYMPIAKSKAQAMLSSGEAKIYSIESI